MVELPADYVPTHALHPGRQLGEELDARAISAEQFAGILQCPLEAVADILTEQQPITSEFASAIEHALGIDAQFWLNLQSLYDQVIERMREDGRELVAEAD